MHMTENMNTPPISLPQTTPPHRLSSRIWCVGMEKPRSVAGLVASLECRSENFDQ